MTGIFPSHRRREGAAVFFNILHIELNRSEAMRGKRNNTTNPATSAVSIGKISLDTVRGNSLTTSDREPCRRRMQPNSCFGEAKLGNNRLTCRRAFQQGERERVAVPLASGLYKLRELRVALEADLELLTVIMRAKMCAPGRARAFGLSAPEGAAGWLKSLPLRVSGRLGYDLRAAILGLVGDRVPPSRAKRIAADVRKQTAALIDQFQTAHDRLRIGGVRVEFEQMKHGESTLGRVMLDAVEVVASILAVVDVREQVR